jgi:hypothetical protein
MSRGRRADLSQLERKGTVTCGRRLFTRVPAAKLLAMCALLKVSMMRVCPRFS